MKCTMMMKSTMNMRSTINEDYHEEEEPDVYLTY